MPNNFDIPSSRVPFIDQRTNLISREWYRYLLNVTTATQTTATVNLSDVEQGPPTQDLSGDFFTTLQEAQLSQQSYNLGTMASVEQDNVRYLGFSTVPSPAIVTNTPGQMWWNATGTLNIAMGGGNITQQVGEETYIYGQAKEAIVQGQVITRSSGTAQDPSGEKTVRFEPAPIGTTDVTLILGVATEDIAKNAFGRITTFGVIHDLDTSGLGDGTPLWYDPSVLGGYTISKPSAPNMKYSIGNVLKAAGGTNGSILVKLTAGSILGATDSNVEFTTLNSGNLLVYDATAQYWKNAYLTAGSGVSITNGPGSVTIAATGSGGTVTSVSGTGTVNGITLTGAVTTSGSLTLGGTLSGVSLTTQVTGTLPITNGGTGITTTPVNGALLIGNGTGYASSTLTAGTGVSIANGLGSITISATGSGGTVTSVSGTGTVNGITLTGTVTTSGNLTLGGTLSGVSLTTQVTGTLPVANGGTGLTTTPANGALLIGNGTGYTSSTLTAGTGVSVSNGAGTITVTNSAPDQIVSLTGAGTTTVTGSYPNFTITSNDQYTGTVTSVSGTGNVNGITLTGTVTSSGSLTLGGTLSNVSLTTQVTGTLPVTNGGTGTATAFTLGSVVFAGASGVYSQNNANFFWDNTNTRLGIGTATPSARLHVSGGDGYFTNTAGAATGIEFAGNGNTVGSSSLLIGQSSAGVALILQRAAANLQLGTNGSYRQYIGSDGYFAFNASLSSSYFYNFAGNQTNVSQGAILNLSSAQNVSTDIGVYGMQNTVTYTVSGGTNSYIYANSFNTYTTVNSGATTSTVRNFSTFLGFQGANSGNVTNAIAFAIDGNYYPSISGTLAIYSTYGLYMGNLGAVTSGVTITVSYGIYIGNQTGASTSYSIYSAGGIGVHVGSMRFGGTSNPVNTVDITGSLGRGAPVTKTGDFTVGTTENWIICNKSSTMSITLPAASSWTGREIYIKTIANQAVNSASSNVVPVNTASAGTAILTATAGKWATLVSDGSNWIIMATG